MRNISFTTGEYYHVYNRGVDHRNIVLDEYDSNRFLQCMYEFNTKDDVVSLYSLSFENTRRAKHPLVEIIAYCLNPNHYHFVLRQIVDNGISLFMKKLGGGHSYYFNIKHKRAGTLFQGPFKAKHIIDNDYLLHLSAYVNLNNIVHQLSHQVTKLIRSSMGEYLGKTGSTLCTKNLILDQFDSPTDYERFAIGSLELMLKRKSEEREMKSLLID